MFIDPSTGTPLPFPKAVTSGLSVGIPGNLMTWQRAIDRWGRFGLAAVGDDRHFPQYRHAAVAP